MLSILVNCVGVNIDVISVEKYLIHRKNPKTMIWHVIVGAFFVRPPCLEEGTYSKGRYPEERCSKEWVNKEQM